MLVREIIQRIQSANSRGVNSDDSRLTNRHIYNKINTVRAFLMGRLIRNRKAISSWNYYTLPCVEVIEVPTNEECPCIPPSGCTVFRTKHPIPKPFMDNMTHKIKNVTDLERNTNIDYIAVSQIKYLNGGKYTQSNVRYFLENGYMYFTHPMKLKSVRVSLIPEDILKAQVFPSYCEKETEESCFSILDTEYPIDSDLLELLIQMTYEELVTAFSQARQDLDNNSVDTAVNPSRVSSAINSRQPEQSQENNNE